MTPVESGFFCIGVAAVSITAFIAFWAIVYIPIHDRIKRRRGLRRLRSYYEARNGSVLHLVCDNRWPDESIRVRRHHGPPGIAPIRPSRYDPRDSSTS